MCKAKERSMTTIWASPLTSCQLCESPFNGQMFDARLPGLGWGNYCAACFRRHDGRLGTGLGQAYQLDTREGLRAWFKIAG